MHSQKSIGVFDSGVGGLSVLREIHQLLPHENLVYVADSEHAPYGDKSKEFILSRSTAIFEFFMRQSVKAIVVACNTATAAAVKELRTRYDLPLVALEPAIKPASEQTQTGVIGVLATSRTIHSNNFQILFNRFAHQVKIIAQACPGLVDQVEQGDLDSRKTRQLLWQYLAPLVEQQVDIIVLGCTHYPFLAPVIRELTGNQIKVIDSGSAIARRLAHLLEVQDLHAKTQHPGSVVFYSSAKAQKTHKVISTLWGSPVSLECMTEDSQPLSARA